MGVVDFGYLETYAAGDRRVVLEVLELFLTEARGWRGRLEGAAHADVVHTIKGAARGVGAVELGRVCEQAERAGPAAAPQVAAALDAAVAEIEAYLKEA